MSAVANPSWRVVTFPQFLVNISGNRRFLSRDEIEARVHAGHERIVPMGHALVKDLHLRPVSPQERDELRRITSSK